MVYTIENELLKVSVEDTGAQLKSIFDKKSSTELLWQGNEEYWKGRAYNLFPIVGRLYEGKYSYRGKVYEMERHGFARGKKFYLCEKSATSMTFDICSDDETLKSYPFCFIFKVTFSLDNNKIDISYEITNIGDEKMYFGLGAHPGFNVPFKGGEFEDYEIEFDSPCDPKKVLFGETCLITGKTEPFALSDKNSFVLRHDLFDNDAVVLRDVSRSVTLKKVGENGGITVRFPDMPFVGFWHTPLTNAPFLCVEPWANLPSKEGGVENITTKENIGEAKAGETVKKRFSINVDL